MFIVMMCFAINVKADVSALGVIPNYTTVNKGDTITLSLGNDYLWDESMVVSDYDEEKDKYEYQMTAENNYMAIPMYIIVDSDVFELDISENKVPNSNYIFEDYKKTTNGDKTIYEFNFEFKSLKDEEGNAYDGKIDNIFVSNLKLKVKENALPGTYFIETISTNDLEEDYYNSSSYVVDRLPITILGNNAKTEYTLKTISDGVINKNNYDITLKKGINNALYYGEIDYTNLSCSKKCLVNGIGSDVYYDDEAKYLKYKVTYEDKTTEEYTVVNDIAKASIDTKWAINFSKTILVIGNSKINKDKLDIDNIAKTIRNFDDGCDKLIYDYDKLNDIDKDILSNLNKDFSNLDDPYIYIIYDNKVLYDHHGYLTQDEINNIQKEIDKKQSESTTTESLKGHFCEDSNCYEEEQPLDISEYYMYIVIGMSILIVILILVVTIIKKKKNNTNIE